MGYAGKNKEYPLYIVSNNAKKPSAAVCFSAGIHGDEIAGSFAVLEFIKKHNFSNFKNIKIILIPVANPTGFDKCKRCNYLNKDLNGLFCKKVLSGENKLIYFSIKNSKIIFFHALHEDVDEKSFYLYNFEKKQEQIYRDIIKEAKQYFPINTAEKIYNDSALNGMIINRKDGSFEDRMFRDGVPYSMCTETPGKQPLKKRVELNRIIMEMALGFAYSQIKK